jgi:hypothetical protein
LTGEIDSGGTKRQKRGRKPKTERRERNPLEKARDRKLIARLHLRWQLWTYEEIAAEVNRLHYDAEVEARMGTGLEAPHISKQMVSNELKALRARLNAEAVEDMLTLRRMRIAELRELEEYARMRYEATIGTHVKTRTTSGGGGDKCKDGATTTEEEELSGELGYLNLALACKREIMDLESAKPPRKTALTNPDGTKPFDAFGESEELKRLAAVFTEITKRTL